MKKGHKEEIYYCALMSYGSKGYVSALYLFDQYGKILQVISNNEFVEISGITDVDKDGSHELIIHYSSGDYSGGVAILALKRNSAIKQVNLVLEAKIETYSD